MFKKSIRSLLTEGNRNDKTDMDTDKPSTPKIDPLTDMVTPLIQILKAKSMVEKGSHFSQPKNDIDFHILSGSNMDKFDMSKKKYLDLPTNSPAATAKNKNSEESPSNVLSLPQVQQIIRPRSCNRKINSKWFRNKPVKGTDTFLPNKRIEKIYL